MDALQAAQAASDRAFQAAKAAQAASTNHRLASCRPSRFRTCFPSTHSHKSSVRPKNKSFFSRLPKCLLRSRKVWQTPEHDMLRQHRFASPGATIPVPAQVCWPPAALAALQAAQGASERAFQAPIAAKAASVLRTKASLVGSGNGIGGRRQRRQPVNRAAAFRPSDSPLNNVPSVSPKPCWVQRSL